MQLPSDNYILLSLVNTALRDKYASLEELCAEEDASADEICNRLGGIGFRYDPSVNSFKA